jgi:hypothetical protein
MPKNASSSPSSRPDGTANQAPAPTYDVSYVPAPPPLNGQWDSPHWAAAPPLDIAHFHPRSSDHRPRVQARLLHSGEALHVLFRVEDRYVRAACTQYGEKVCRDSCVEIFLQPRPEAGYLNFETNCGGTMLIWYVTDATPVPGGLKASNEVPPDAARTIGVFHSLPRHVPRERAEPTEWRLGLAIPFDLLERYVGPLGDLRGQRWRANLFKCADDTSHPHWASWSPIGPELNFHQPRHFGELTFR